MGVPCSPGTAGHSRRLHDGALPISPQFAMRSAETGRVSTDTNTSQGNSPSTTFAASDPPARQTAKGSGLPMTAGRGHSRPMGTKSRESIYGSSIRASAERAAAARKQADRLACEAWNQRMLGYKGPAQPSPALG